MKEILESLGDVGFHDSKDHVGKPLDGRISAEVIVTRFKERKEVPREILGAIQNIKDQEKKKKAAVHILRLTLYARTIVGQSGGILSWFENGKVKDLGNSAKIPVSIIKKSAVAFNKVAGKLSDAQQRLDKLSEQGVEITKKKQSSIDKTAAKADFYEEEARTEEESFLQALDHIYMSLASERK